MIDRDVLEAIGLVAVSTATLESVMADVAVAIDRSLDWDRLVRSTRATRDALAASVGTLKAQDAELGARAEQWQTWANNRVADRHVIVHSILYTLDDDLPDVVRHWHPVSGHDEEFDIGRARHQAHNTDRCTRAGFELVESILEAQEEAARGS